MITRRKHEHNELTRKNKKNSLDMVEAWGIVNETDEMIRISREFDCSDEYFEQDYIRMPINTTDYSSLKKQDDKTIDDTQNDLKRLKELQDEKVWEFKWNSNGAFVTISRTFNIPQALFIKYLDDIKKGSN